MKQMKLIYLNVYIIVFCNVAMFVLFYFTIVYERTASTKYAEHDALLQLPDVSFIPARKEIRSMRLTDWTDSLAQTYGNLERLQYTKVDAIITADLNTGRKKAKIERKKLTKGISSLLDRVVALRKIVEEERNQPEDLSKM